MTLDEAEGRNRLIVYDETGLGRDAAGFDVKALESELSGLGIELDVRAALPGPEATPAWKDWLAWHLAWSKVRDPGRRIPPELEPAALEIDRERRALAGQARPPGPLYDGRRLVESFHGPLPGTERAFDPDRPVVVLTDRLMGTFEGARYHIRFLVTGHPCIVSPPGLLEGPARDRSFYLAKQLLGKDPTGVVDDDHLTKQDPRWVTATASALLQVVAYHRAGDPFCEEEACRLFNPHWQRELLESMAGSTLCDAHPWLVPP